MGLLEGPFQLVQLIGREGRSVPPVLLLAAVAGILDNEIRLIKLILNTTVFLSCSILFQLANVPYGDQHLKKS